MTNKKKGFLLAEETIKIVIALICIGFLVYLLFSIYYSSRDSHDLEQAKATLDYLIQNIEFQSTEVQIFNPENLYLISWPFEGQIPSSCSNMGWQNCLCICDDSKECDEWVCKETPKKTVVFDKGQQIPLKIEDPPLELNIEYSQDEIIITKKGGVQN